MKKVVWVTGGLGFIGKHLTTLLLTANYIVCVINRNETIIKYFLTGNDIVLNYGTDDGETLFDILYKKYGQPFSIFHLAGSSSVAKSNLDPYKSFVDTVVLTTSILDFIRRSLNCHEISFYITSSAAVYGNEQSGLISEKTTPLPYSNYGYHKLLSELTCKNYAKTYGIKIIIFRLFSVYGNDLRKQLIWDICNKLSNNSNFLELSGIGDEIRDWIHVSDVVNLMIDSAKFASEDAPIINIATGKGTKVCDIVEKVKDSFGFNTKIIFSGEKRLGDPFSLVGDINKLNSIFKDFNFKNIDVGIKEYVSWYKNSL
jgi:UDP-glucose 4-epimerase